MPIKQQATAFVNVAVCDLGCGNQHECRFNESPTETQVLEDAVMAGWKVSAHTSGGLFLTCYGCYREQQAVVKRRAVVGAKPEAD